MNEDTERTTENADEEPRAKRMGDVDHTHPHRNTTFGSVFGRGPTVAADGGAPAERDDADMSEVDHESPTGVDASDAFARGSTASDEFHGVASDE